MVGRACISHPPENSYFTTANQTTNQPTNRRWVREELHRWVYDNVRTKWAAVRKRPLRLPGLFSGYHASRALVAEVGRANLRSGGCCGYAGGKRPLPT